MYVGASLSSMPRSWKFWRVVISAQPSSPHASTTEARYRVCSEVITPLGSLRRIMYRP